MLFCFVGGGGGGGGGRVPKMGVPIWGFQKMDDNILWYTRGYSGRYPRRATCRVVSSTKEIVER